MPDSKENSPLVVLGAGVMGTAIAALAVGHGHPVTLVDTSAGARAAAPDAVALHLRTARLMGALPHDRPPGELTVEEAPAAVATATAVIEAVTEDPERKAEVLADLASVARPGTLLVSNTSGVPIDELADAVPRPEDLVGVHFMNPAYVIPTVEVVLGPRSGEAAARATRDLLSGLGRRGIVVGDGAGFVTSRLLHRMLNDAIAVVHEGRATPETVDALMRDCIGHRTGPLATADLIGLDNLADSLRVMHERTGDPALRPSELLLDKVRQGLLGRKSGRGFYDYQEATR
ncbi:putative dehydrogenase [Streptomyces ambofaciens ATCC 23877]|uniref:3-hydroxyacyl-CoA dehydrogenase n=2 Tax=Streptomyces ambofaciens TaxID=1889 RepID=A8Y8I9_STRAM|nr:3-hydroxyacyl-CoA dehydrogenase family protein [Streptomyces ambofaciens]AKZ58645.1 putative dehydrogenase [Streptomyces ambofaciens ATCC 23877]ANB09050.1 3-hydroxyacyl-CoA dehydrogenase [Streptomyces ambofaciens]CAM96604.1 putative dehydrogenase [Streptomyces ambofaciens ATCC 23877]